MRSSCLSCVHGGREVPSRIATSDITMYVCDVLTVGSRSRVAGGDAAVAKQLGHCTLLSLLSTAVVARACHDHGG